jgi:hypothetical protein
MRVKLLIAMALASVFLLAGTVIAVAGDGPCYPVCNVKCIVPSFCPSCNFQPAVCKPGYCEPCEVKLAECHPIEPCNVRCTCPTLEGCIKLTSPGGICFKAPCFECPSAEGPEFCGPSFKCPVIWDP